MNTLKKDFQRFQTLHSWYKHIPLEGIDFYAYQDVGEQPRNGVHPQVNDISASHWYFSTKEPTDRVSLKARFGPFLRGVEGGVGEENVWGFWIIYEDAGAAKFNAWIAKKYPEWIGVDWSNRDDTHDPQVIELFRRETNKYYGDLWMAMGPD